MTHKGIDSNAAHMTHIECHTNDTPAINEGLRMLTTTENIDLIWGADAIARAIGRSARVTFYMLEKGELPAKKVGGRWVIERSKLIAFFMETAA